MKLGFIGAGEMGSSIIKGLLAHGYEKENIMASVRTPESMARLQSALGITAVVDNARVFREADWIFLAVKPAQMPEVLAQIVAEKIPFKPLVSMALGWTVEKIQHVLPAWPVIRIMPNTPLSVGEGMTLFDFANETPAPTRCEVMKLFEKMGKSLEVAPNLFDVATAVSGSGPAFVYAFIDALAQGGVGQGMDEKQAILLAAQTVLGAAKLAMTSHETPNELARKVATPGGCTAEGMKEVDASDLKAILQKAVAATTRKAEEVSKKS